jgi:hypothetical protein
MATAQSFNAFSEHLAEGVHDLGSDTLKVLLTNTAPVAGNSVRADLTELSAGGGYTSGGNAATVTSSSQTSGLYKLVIENVVFTASAGTIGPFRYAVLYNDTPTSPADPLIKFWDYGASITLQDGETFTFDADATDGILQISQS